MTLAHSPEQKQASHPSTSDKPLFSILAGSGQTRLLALLSSEAQITVSPCRELLDRAENPFLHPLGNAVYTALILLQKQISI